MPYTTHNGIITSPGKFEGEPEYVLHFWEEALNGNADEQNYDNGTDEHWFAFHIGPDDIANYPGCFELGDHLSVWECDQGFVHHNLVNKNYEPKF